MASQGGITIASNNLIRSNPIIHRHGNYNPLSEDSGQEILVDDDLTFYISGRKTSQTRYICFVLVNLLTLGLVSLASKWYPMLEMIFKTEASSLENANILAIKNQYNELSLVQVGLIRLEQTPFCKVFPKHVHNTLLNSVKYFEYRYFGFLFNPEIKQFEPIYGWRDPEWTSTKNILSNPTTFSKFKQIIFGSNQIDIKSRSDFQILVDEVLHPFFVFQIASIILWSMDEYYYYAACIFIISVVSTTITFYETKENLKRMRGLAKFSCHAIVWRENTWKAILSEDLVPGDIFQFKSGDMQLFPCDAVLLTGDCIVNESMLTGESLPVSKTPIPDSELKSMDFEAEEPSSSAHMSKYFLFSGTKIIRARGSKVPPESVITPNSNCALALVVRTGFNTAKGSLIRSMLFPKPNTFKFYQDSFKFIGMLAILSFMGFLASFYNFIKLKLSWHVIIVRALDLITIAVPPALPATMAIGTTFAISRLKKLYIFCTSPPRVNIGGKINMMCFDKTGTLTQEGLDVLGVRFTVSTNSIMEVSEEPLQNGPLRFSKLYTTISSLLATPFIIQKKQEYANASVASISGISVFESRSAGNPNKEADFPYPLIVCAMACCHSIKVVSGELIGDPLDLKMFEFINWNIDEDTKESPIHPSFHIPTILTVRPHWVPSVDSVKANNEFSDEIHTELGVIKSFEFVSALRRMSVIVHRFKYSSSVKYHGVQDESDDTFDFDIFLKGAPEVMAGICVPDSIPSDYISQLREYTHHGYRVLAVAWKKLRSHTVTQACEIPRDQIEKDMHFLGFIIFENKLKAGTTGVIRTLNTALIRQVMCTGDNVLTSISVSKECEIIRSADRVFIPKFERGMSHEEDAQLVWHDVDYPQIRLDPITFQPNAVLPIGDFVLAITGDAFQWMLDFGTDESFHRMLVKGSIFARMSPDQKQFLVQNLQAIGYVVGFCGDGTNDCGALKAADIGLSLSEAEASVAAPFTSQDKDLRCVLSVIREGRVALYMALYSLIQFSSVSILYSLAQNIGDFQFMYIDLCIIIPIAVFMGQTGPHASIYRKRPTASLVSAKVLTSIIGQTIISFSFQYFAFRWVQTQSWYIPGTADIDNQRYQSFENSIVFLVSCYQYITAAIVFTVGPPYQASIWKNIPLVFTLILITGFTIVATIWPPKSFVDLFVMMVFPLEARYFIIEIAIFNFLTSWSSERYFLPLCAKLIGKLTNHVYIMRNSETTASAVKMAKYHKWRKSGKIFKIIQDEFK